MVAKKTCVGNDAIKIYSDYEYCKKLARYRRAKKKRVCIAILAFGLMLSVIGVIISFAKSFNAEEQCDVGSKEIVGNIDAEPVALVVSDCRKSEADVIGYGVIQNTKDMYVIEKVNLRTMPNTDSEIKESLEIGTCVNVTVDGEWAYSSDLDGYIKAEFLSCYMPNCDVYDVSDKQTTNFKSYMSYTKITSKTSKQYKIQSTIAYSGLYGIRTVKERFCVAIGTYFNASVGDYVDIVLENGTIIYCIVADIKDDKDTDSDNILTLSNGCSTEFIVDIDALNNDAKTSGNISMCNSDWNSRVVKIVVYDKNVLEVD